MSTSCGPQRHHRPGRRLWPPRAAPVSMQAWESPPTARATRRPPLMPCGMVAHDRPLRSGAGAPAGGRAAAATPAAPARGSAQREDKDGGSRTAVRRLARRGEDKGFAGIPYLPLQYYPAAAAPAAAARHARLLAAVDPEAERGAGRKGMVMWWHTARHGRDQAHDPHRTRDARRRQALRPGARHLADAARHQSPRTTRRRWRGGRRRGPGDPQAHRGAPGERVAAGLP